MPPKAKKKTAAKKKQAILVLGMHRSGTSAVTRLINMLGVGLSKNLMPAVGNNNDKGFWEHKDIVDVHEKLLEHLNSSWDDTKPLAKNWWKDAGVKKFEKEIIKIIKRDFSKEDLWAVKDPRLSLLLPFWINILNSLNIEPLFLITLRAPNNVANSLAKRDQFALEKSLLLWTKYNLETEIETRQHKRVFISFDQLSSSWEDIAQKVAEKLEIKWKKTTKSIAKRFNDFLEPSLIHHKKEAKFTCDNKEISDWAKKTYQIFLKLIDGKKKVDTSNLEKIYDQLRSKVEPSAEFYSFWFDETIRYRNTLADAYSTLHKRDLDIIEMDKKIGALEKNLHQSKVELRETKHKAQQLDASLEESEKKLSKEKSRADEYTRKYETLHSFMETVYNSKSWKITAPLRLLKRLYASKELFFYGSTYSKLFKIFKTYGIEGVIQKIKGEVLTRLKDTVDITEWFDHYRPDDIILHTFRNTEWPKNAPKLSVLMCVYNTRPEWLHQAILSVLNQTYPNWELILVNDGSKGSNVKRILNKYAKKDDRVKAVNLAKNKGVSGASNEGLKRASGDFVCFMDHDDILEPHALHRFAKAILSDKPDIIYSDEVTTEEDIDVIDGITANPQFSYDYYISHPYFVHFVGIKASILKEIGGFDEKLKVSHDYDLVLRAIEKSKKVSHISDFLYRWRTVEESLGHEKQKEVEKSSVKALEKHVSRLGFKSAEIRNGKSFNFYDVVFNHKTKTKVAIIIPTKNRADLLKTCVESLEKTVKKETADIYIVDHESDEKESKDYLKKLAKKYTVLKHSGPFNFSTINNKAVDSLKGKYTHYLFLNNDIEALDPGWLEHMLGTAKREEVGIVGAILLYPNYQIQHAGVIVGLHGAAEHSHKFDQFRDGEGLNRGFNGSLLSTRDYSAVTAACLLMRADAFAAIDGFDEDLAVGFGDTDLCLRAVEKGYKVLMDPNAVLIHHESVTRGKSEGKVVDPHPKDSKLFISRYRKIIENGDPYFSPLLANDSSHFELKSFLTKCPIDLDPRTVDVVLPKPVEEKIVKLKKSA